MADALGSYFGDELRLTPNVSGRVDLSRAPEPDFGRSFADKLADSWATRDQRQTMAVAPFYAIGRLLSGETPIIDPSTGSLNPSVIPDALNAAGLAMTGGIGGAGAGGTVLGSGPVRPTGDVMRGLWQHAEQPTARAPILPGDTRVSTRFPTAVGATENPLTHHLSIDTSAMSTSPGFSQNVSVLSDYPGFARLKGMSDTEAVQAYIKQAQDNLQYLYERSPQMMKERSPLWYEGAHEISDALANRWGVPRQSASASLASLSPQMDWFKNASLGERVGDIMTSAAAGRPMTSEMLNWARSRTGDNAPELKPEHIFRQGSGNREVLDRITGKSFDQLTDPLDKAIWLRMYDEAHNPREYRSITPEGRFGEFITTQEGVPEKVGWGSFGEISKAIRAMESGGDMNVISPVLGLKHKVRNFYNNIENPNDPRFGDITADTHAVAAAQMRPLSGASAAVSHNLASGGSGHASSALTGVQGTYGFTADATRRMAEANNMLPRAAQSATWEPVRELFTDVWKRNPQNVDAVNNIWSAVDRGEITAAQARDKIFDLAGGIGTPEWGRPGLKTFAPAEGSTYR